MVYLTKEEQALFTLIRAQRIESAGLLVTNVGAAASGIVSSILTAFAGATLDSLRPNIKAYLGRNMSIAISMKAAEITNIEALIEDTLNIDYNQVIDLMKGGIGQGVGGVHAGLYEQLAGVNALMSGYLGLIQRIGIDPYIQRWVNATVQPNIPDSETSWFMAKIGKLTDAKYSEYLKQDGWSENFKEALEWSWIRQPPIDVLLDCRRRGLLDDASLKMLFNWHRYTSPIIDMVASLAVQVPELYRLADFAAKGLLSDEDLRKYFAWFGVGTPWDWIWRDSQYVLPSASALFEMRWRGLIDDGLLDLGLKRTPIHKDFIVPMKGLLEQIPPAGDLVTMVVREAFEPAYVVEAPTVFAAEMAKKGFTKLWSDRYWTGHFLPMPIEYAYDNLRRGYWTKEQFLELLRIADIHPKWREDIYNVAFNPPSIREMGYGYDVGVYTIDDIVRFRRWGGLSEADAKKAGQAMVAYRTEAEREAVRREYLNAYVLGKINTEQFKEYLIKVGTAPEAIPLWVERGNLRLMLKETETSVTEPKTITRSDAQWLFEHGIRNEDWLRSVLKNLGYSDSSINAYVDQSKRRIAEKEKPPKVTVKELTLGDLRAAFRNDVISEASFRAELYRRKYSEEDIDVIVALEILRKPIPPEVKPREVTPAQLSILFRKGIITESEYRSELKARKYTDVDINRIVDLDKQRMIVPPPEVKYRDLTLSMIQNLVKLGLLDKTEALNAIQALDYTEKDAALIYEIMVSRVYEEPEPRELTDAHITALYDYNLVSESDILAHFIARGYTDNDARLLTQLAVITKNLPDLKDMYSKGWINQAQLFEGVKALGIPMEAVEPAEFPKLSKLIEVIGLPEEKAKRIMLTIVKAEVTARTQTERDLTKAEIVKGVKVGVITPVEAVSLLQGIGYDEDEAWYILAINKVIAAGDPEGYWDMRRVTELQKKARGLPSVDVPEELVMLERQRRQAISNLNKLKVEKASEADIGEAAVSLANIEARIHTIVAKLQLA